MSKGAFNKLGALNTVLSRVSIIALLGMMFLTVVDVAMRYIFRAPLLGVHEISEFLMVIIVFLSLGYTQAQEGHVAVDIFVSRLSKRAQLIIEFFNHGVTLVLLLLMAWETTLTGVELMETMEVSGTLPIPVFPFGFIVSLGYLAMCAELVRDYSKILEYYKP